MNKLRKALALILSLAAILCFPISASALSDEALPTIDYARTGSVDIYKYDLTSAEKDGVWNSSYVSTGVRDEAGVESILGNTQIVNHRQRRSLRLRHQGSRVQLSENCGHLHVH